MLNRKYGTNKFQRTLGYIEIGDNVMIGSGMQILFNVKIGVNVIIGAGPIVTKGILDNSVVAGFPYKVIGNFDDLVKKRKHIVAYDKPEL